MTPQTIDALKSAAYAVAAAANGDASHLMQTIAPGLKTAVAKVPNWTHAYQVLTAHISALAKDVSTKTRVGNAVGAGWKAVSHGFGHGR